MAAIYEDNKKQPYIFKENQPTHDDIAKAGEMFVSRLYMMQKKHVRHLTT